MGTLEDYIKWRGDLTFSQDGFNMIDNLVLSCISYVEMDEVFNASSQKEMTLQEITDIYFKKVFPKKSFRDGSILKDAPITLKAISKTGRYKSIKVRNYVSKNDVKKTLQFAAMEFVLPDNTSYIAYRGTDDSIVGWKEDFRLATSEVEAEKEAVKYLNEVAKDSSGKLRVGGHSKGGHLALYAVAKCNQAVRDRVKNIYSNDGPGFMKKVAQSKAIKDVTPRLVSIVPEDTVVGLLMEPVGKFIVVKSKATALAQHNLATWCIEGKKLVTTKEVSKTAKLIDTTLKENISKMSPKELDEFVDNLFAIFEATGALTLTELKSSGLKGLQALSKKALETINSKK
ncbi:Mbeg1-like protein [Pseudobutyrivibrio sp.]